MLLVRFTAVSLCAAPVKLGSSDAAVLISTTLQSVNHNTAFSMELPKRCHPFMAAHAQTDSGPAVLACMFIASLRTVELEAAASDPLIDEPSPLSLF